MIGCKTENGIEYITRIEHFRDLMSENIYAALIEFLNKCGYDQKAIINDLESDLASALEDKDIAEINCDNIESRLTNIICSIEDMLSKDLTKEEIIESLTELI